MEFVLIVIYYKLVKGDYVMRVVLQNVYDCTLIIDQKEYSHIDKGFLLLVGFTEGDTLAIIEKMVNKIVGLRVFPDENGKTNLSLKDVNGEIMSVSQFTLYADAKKGYRPSFIEAMRPEKATVLYDEFNKCLVNAFGKIETGVFGADMKISFTNDGPFTLILDSKELWG